MGLGLSTQFAVAFSLILARLVGFFLFAPVFATFVIPLRFRAVMIFVFTLISTNLIHPTHLPEDTFTFGGLIVKELLVGFTLAFTVGVIFLGAQIAGAILDDMIGFSLTNIFDRLGVKAPGVIRKPI